MNRWVLIDSAVIDSAVLASPGLGFDIYHKNSVGDPNTFQVFSFKFLVAYYAYYATLYVTMPVRRSVTFASLAFLELI